MSMGLLLKRGLRDFKPCVAQGETAREAEMPLRLPIRYRWAMVALGWKLLTMRKLDARYGVAREGKPGRNG
jgi:hypothetical protein